MALIDEVTIRNIIKPGDLGYLIYLHGSEYARELNYGIPFELYVAKTVVEFYGQYDPSKDRIWICEHSNHIVGSLVLMHRSNTTAQLRYFFIKEPYRRIGLGNKLMNLFIQFLQEHHYQAAYLLTTDDQEIASRLYEKYGFTLSQEEKSSTFGKTQIERRFDLIL